MDDLKYISFKAIDFIMDDDFLRFVRTPSNEDVLFWKSFLKKHPEKTSEIEEAKLLIYAIEPVQDNPTSFQIQNTWYKIADRTNAGRNRNFLRQRKVTWGALAFFFLLLMGSVFLLNQNNQTFSYKTGFGQTASVHLPDQSTVFINSNSTLKVTYGGWLSTRTMELDGEAYFTIEKSRKFGFYQPCKVITNQAVVHVTGTKFNVNSRETKTKVFLEEGSVNLSKIPGISSMMLLPGDAVVIDAVTRSVSKSKSTSENFTGWVNGKLVFNQTPLAEILETIEELYGLSGKLESPSLLNKTFTGKVPSDNLEVLLKALQEAFDISVEKKEGVLHFKPIKRSL